MQIPVPKVRFLYYKKLEESSLIEFIDGGHDQIEIIFRTITVAYKEGFKCGLDKNEDSRTYNREDANQQWNFRRGPGFRNHQVEPSKADEWMEKVWGTGENYRGRMA